MSEDKELMKMLSDSILGCARKKYPGVKMIFEKVRKNNGKVYTGVNVRFPESKAIVPIIPVGQYLQMFLSGEADIEDIMEDIIHTAEKAKVIDQDFFELRDYEKVKDSLYLKLINREMNQEYLKQVPFIPFLDLAIIFYVGKRADDGNGMACTVTHDMLKVWGVSLMQLSQSAYENMRQQGKVVIRPISDFLPGVLQHEGFFPMYVLQDDALNFGATGILFLDELKEFSKKIGSNIWIIPSSIYEVILMPEGKIDAERILDTIEVTNDSVVKEEDRLSYHVYRYDKEKNVIEDMTEEMGS